MSKDERPTRHLKAQIKNYLNNHLQHGLPLQIGIDLLPYLRFIQNQDHYLIGHHSIR